MGRNKLNKFEFHLALIGTIEVKQTHHWVGLLTIMIKNSTRNI